MTDVNKNKSNKINSIEDALSLYAPPPAAFVGKMGMEVEMAIVTPNGFVPDAGVMKVLQDHLLREGFDAQLEPCGVIEYASPAVDVSDAVSLQDTVAKDIKVFERYTNLLGLQRVPFCIVPTTTEKDALGKIASRERLQVSIQAMQDIFDRNTLRLPLLTAGVQTSFSPKDAEQMFRMVTRAYMLTPLLMASCNTFSGFVNGEEDRKDYLPRGKYYLGYGDAGGISPAFLKSSTGDEFIRNHIEEVFNAPMHFAYDADG
jgi:hypothetical protein